MQFCKQWQSIASIRPFFTIRNSNNNSLFGATQLFNTSYEQTGFGLATITEINKFN